MLKVTISGATNEGKSTIAALLAKVLAAHDVEVNLMDDDGEAERLRFDENRFTRNLCGLREKYRMFGQAVLIHTEDEGRPVNTGSPFGFVTLRHENGAQTVDILRSSITTIYAEGDHTVVVTARPKGEGGSYNFIKVLENAQEVRERMKQCEWAEKVDVLANHTVRSVKNAMARK